MGEIVQFIPRNRRYLEDFPVIHEREIFATAPSEMNPDKEPA